MFTSNWENGVNFEYVGKEIGLSNNTAELAPGVNVGYNVNVLIVNNVNNILQTERKPEYGNLRLNMELEGNGKNGQKVENKRIEFV